MHKVGNRVIKGIINKKSNPCPVKFYHIIPENLKKCPFIVTVSVGEHNHPPHQNTESGQSRHHPAEQNKQNRKKGAVSRKKISSGQAKFPQYTDILYTLFQVTGIKSSIL